MTRQRRRSPAQIRRDFREWWPEIHNTLPRLPENVALDAAKQIARFDPRQAHKKAVAEQKKTRLLIDRAHALLLSSQLQLFDPTISDQLNPLTHVRDAIGAINLSLPRSGGQVLRHKKKVYTAGGCYYLLKRYTNQEPRHDRGDWVWFSAIMFKIATGEDTDMHEACREWAEMIAVPGRVVFLEWP
jgi:hypothetical protein